MKVCAAPCNANFQRNKSGLMPAAGRHCPGARHGKSAAINHGEEAMPSRTMFVIAAGLMLTAGPSWSQDAAPARSGPAPQTNWWSQAAGENGPSRVVWAAQKTPETLYNKINKPIWHIADVLKAH